MDGSNRRSLRDEPRRLRMSRTAPHRVARYSPARTFDAYWDEHVKAAQAAARAPRSRRESPAGTDASFPQVRRHSGGGRDMSPRILILTASVGAGHNRGAQAVELAMREICPGAMIKNVDVLDLCNPAFRWLYGKSYFEVVAAAPHLVGYLYDRLDRPPNRLERGVDKVRFGMQHLNLRLLSRLLTNQKWDLAINTHFLPAEVIGTFRKRGRIHFPQVTVTTDFDTHRLWHNPPCEHYFTATEEGRANLAAWGVAPERHYRDRHPGSSPLCPPARCMGVQTTARPG